MRECQHEKGKTIVLCSVWNSLLALLCYNISKRGKPQKNKRIRTCKPRQSDKKYHIFHAEYQQTDEVLKIKTEFFEVIFEKQYISYIS